MFSSLQLGTAFKLLVKTGPILLVRLGMYLAFWTAALVYYAIVIGIAVLLGKIAGWLGWIVAIAGFIAIGPIYNLVYRYFFFILKAAHIAVISELLVRGQLPAGVNQLAWGKQQVQSRFGQVSVMFVVDELIRGVVGAFTRTVSMLISWLPGTSLDQLAGVINRVIRYSTTYIDEAILARAFWRQEQNLWASAEEGVVLYGQAWKPLVKNAVALMVLSYVPFILAFIIFAAPIGGLLALISSQLAAWSVLIVLLLAILIKIAVGDSFAMVAMIAAYQRETAGLAPDPAMAARLSQISGKFVELKNRAIQGVPGGAPAPAAAQGAPGGPGSPAVPQTQYP